ELREAIPIEQEAKDWPIKPIVRNKANGLAKIVYFCYLSVLSKRRIERPILSILVDEAMSDFDSEIVSSHDVAARIDSASCGSIVNGTWKPDRRESPAEIREAMRKERRVTVISNDLSSVIDFVSRRRVCARIIQPCKASSIVNEAVNAERGIYEISNDPTVVINAPRIGPYRVWEF